MPTEKVSVVKRVSSPETDDKLAAGCFLFSIAETFAACRDESDDRLSCRRSRLKTRHVLPCLLSGCLHSFLKPNDPHTHTHAMLSRM